MPILFLFKIDLFILEREKVCTHAHKPGEEHRRENPEAVSLVSMKPDAGLHSQDPEIMI